jgi:DNA-binding MarR family transcriptional regulator
MTNDNNHETEITILENIHANSDGIRQRDLAEIAGLSLGMTNSILKRLAVKGLLTIKRVNNRNIHYIVTPSGIEAITRKSSLKYNKEGGITKNIFILYSENYLPDNDEKGEDKAFLQTLLI